VQLFEATRFEDITEQQPLAQKEGEKQ